jgi:exopolysaccharide biosynthesis protein
MKLRTSVGALVLSALWVPVSEPVRPRHGPRVEWLSAEAGLERAILEVAGGGEGWRTRVIAVRIDPMRFTFRLRARLNGVEPAWSVERAPAAAVVAVNAGQFNGITPWGWLVMAGEEVRPPGNGPLSTAITWDRAGRMHWLRPDEIEPRRVTGEIVEAFQSYPTLIDHRGEIPRQIREAGLGVDVEHRDARLAIGATLDGRAVVALTRFNGFGPLSPAVPLGLNLSEMASVMRRLGCTRAVSLDGGVSAQLLTREHGRTLVWRGWRRVPLGLVAEPRKDLP